MIGCVPLQVAALVVLSPPGLLLGLVGQTRPQLSPPGSRLLREVEVDVFEPPPRFAGALVGAGMVYLAVGYSACGWFVCKFVGISVVCCAGL